MFKHCVTSFIFVTKCHIKGMIYNVCFNQRVPGVVGGEH